VEKNRLLAPDFVPNDSLYLSQWHLPKISAPLAWNLSQGAPGITIAILDSGVDATHPDLAAKLVPGYNFYDNNTNTADVYGHGTMVAGVAAALSNNGIGVASVAWQNLLMPIRVTDTQGYAVVPSLPRRSSSRRARKTTCK
jgi:subtilisin family serine protease